MKKSILLLSLAALLSSCGGSGGGGSAQTNAATPQIPESQSPSQPMPPVGQTPMPDASVPQNPAPDNSISGNPNLQNTNPQNPGRGLLPQNPAAPDLFAKPSDNRTVTGAGVKVGVLDDDFISRDAYTKRFYNDDFLGVGTRFGEVLEKEFEGRFNALPKDKGLPGKDDHGLIVASILAGKSGTGAKGATVYGVSFGEGNGSLKIDINKYKELFDSGVRIYNQSFGTASEFSDYTNQNYKTILYLSILRENQSTADKLNKELEDLNDFYKNAVANGSLFVWAAGNTTVSNAGIVKTYNAPTVQAGLQHFVPELYKGWIAVVGVRADGREFAPHLARAGGAQLWTISANGECGLPKCAGFGSSFAAPRVAAAAAKLKEKFPWMTGHELKQTILTTAKDLGAPGVDGVYGWGLLDEEKALKGPGYFDNELLVGKRASDAGLRGQFNANVTDNVTSVFENDIRGLGGLKKSGNGKLVLTGSNRYRGDTDIMEGTLEIYGDNGSDINIHNGGTLVTYPNAMIGLRTDYSDDILEKNVLNDGGTLENKGSGAVITGNYTARNGAVTKAELGSKLTVKGTVDLSNGSTLRQTMNKYITAKPLSSAVIESETAINGKFDRIEAPEMINASVMTEGNRVTATLSRKNVAEYVEEISDGNADEIWKNVSENLEISFQKLDEEIESGNLKDVSAFSKAAAKIQTLSSASAPAVLDSLSGQIYASAQALTFQQSQTVNKDLANRLGMLGTLENRGEKGGIWVSGIGAHGHLRESGYGTGRTKIAGGQTGIDRSFGDNLILGTAFSYSTADAKFDRYGGESKAQNLGISLYGRAESGKLPVYVHGRAGIGFVNSDVERDIILSSSSSSRARIEHRDRVYSGYLEAGYDVKKGNFVFTPFIAVSHDHVERGAFTEENSQFGLTAEKARYSQTSGQAGVRLAQGFDWGQGSRTTLQGYVTYQNTFNNEDLSFEAAYTGLSDTKFKVKGIGLKKDRTWVGLGVVNEINPGFAWYMNYDAKIEVGKLDNNVFTTGIRVNFN